MKGNWIRTNEIYHQIIAADDLAAKQQLYREQFIAPWQAMMQMMGGMVSEDNEDEFAAARAWAWLLPQDLTAVPPALTKLEAANAWDAGEQAMTAAVKRLAPYADRIPIETITGWLMLADPARANPINRGYTGAIDFTQPQFVVQFDTPNDYNLPRLKGAVVHEMHHLVRLRLFPWDMAQTSVADYIIHEGLAESFAAALFGEDIVGYYVTDFDEAELDTAVNLIRDGLELTGFNLIRAYIFGDSLADAWGFPKLGMPDYGGYAIGYRVVQAYLQRTGRSIEEATFRPALEIVQKSGFFD